MNGNRKIGFNNRFAKVGYPLPLLKLAIKSVFFLVMLLSVPNPMYGQFSQYIISDLVPIDSQSGDVVYMGVGRVKGASANDLFSRAQSYFSTTIRPGSAVILSRRSKRIVRERGIITLTVLRAGVVQAQAYRVTMEVKVSEGKYRYEFSRFAAQPDSVPGNIPIRDLYPPNKRSLDIDPQTARTLQSWDRSVRAYIKGFTQYMSTNLVDR